MPVIQRSFKTGPGEYGEGDRFLGLRVSNIRKVAHQFKQLPLKESEHLHHSKYNEKRLCALIILVNKMKKADYREQEKIYKHYLDNTKFINNRDLVDSSAEHIVGSFCLIKTRPFCINWLNQMIFGHEELLS